MTEYALLPYQQRWLADTARIKVCIKSRRIGITWATAADHVLDAASGKVNCFYMSYNKDLAAEYINTCAKWARDLGILQDPEVEEVYLDEDGKQRPYGLDKDGVQVYRLTFKSGKKITALPATGRALRGHQGRVFLDEAAFMQQFPEIMRSATSLLMWGGGSRIEIVSTADSEANPFMQLCAAIERKDSGYESYRLHKYTFDDALAEGLYKRICLINKEHWTEEKQLAWRDQIIREHGIAAGAELFCESTAGVGVGWFTRDKINIINSIRDISQYTPKVQRVIRFWDLAATKPSAKNPNPDWTVGARVLQLDNGDFLIDDIERIRDDPGAVQEHIVEVAKADGREVEVGIWSDPGAGGKSDSAAKGRALTGFVFHAPNAARSKVDFAKPWASLVAQGRVHVLNRHWTQDLLHELEQFPNGKHDDQVDAISGAFEVMVNQGAYNLDWAKAWDGF